MLKPPGHAIAADWMGVRHRSANANDALNRTLPGYGHKLSGSGMNGHAMRRRFSWDVFEVARSIGEQNRQVRSFCLQPWMVGWLLSLIKISSKSPSGTAEKGRPQFAAD